MEDDVTEQNNRPKPLDSDILQGKADVIRAVQAIASRGNGGAKPDTSSTPEHEKTNPIQVAVRPVVAVRSDGTRPDSAPRNNGAAAKTTPAPRTGAAATAFGTDATDSAKVVEVAQEPPATQTAKPAGVTAAPCAEAQPEASPAEAPKPAPKPSAAAGDSEAASAPEEIKPEADTSSLPRFRLAEQILAEQRRTASERRQRSSASDAQTRPYAAQDTVGEVIREVKNNLTARPAAEMKAGIAAESFAIGDDGMTPIQREIVAEIVARDIALYSGGIARRRTWPSQIN